MPISASKQTMLLEGMTAIARKVYDATPIQEHWHIRDIATELGRRNHMIDYRVVGGCLNALVSCGLVKESGKNEYRQVPVRKSLEVVNNDDEDNKEEEIMATRTTVIEIPQKTPLDRMGEFASDILVAADRLRDIAHQIQEEILNIGIQNEENEKKYKRLKELATLLKSVGDEI